VDANEGWGDAMAPSTIGAGAIRHPRSSDPFAHPGLGRRIAPFAIAAALAEASLAFSYGSIRLQPTVDSVGLLALVALLVALPYDRFPPGATVAVPLVYMGSLLALNLAVRGSNAGFGPVLLIPLVWTALYHRRFDTWIVVMAIVPFEIVTSLWPTRYADAAIVRRVVSWLLLGAMVAYAIHYLRSRFARAISDELHLRHQTDGLVALAKELTALHDPGEVIWAATRAVAHLAEQTTDGPVRAHFLEVHDGVVNVRAQFDTTGDRIEDTWPLMEQPWLAEVLASGQPCSGTLDRERAGPTVQKILRELQLTHAVWVPVTVHATTKGVLSLTSRGVEPTPRVLALATAIGNLTELALGNALTHQSLLTEAVTDPLTGLANRRGFQKIVSARSPGVGFAVIVTDVDDLKSVNDQHGHEAGDALLIGVAAALRAAVRHGDVVARMGGDEFAAILAGVTEDQAIRAAIRMMSSVRKVVVGDRPASISLGIAWSRADPEEALRDADAAMYHSKRSGGGRWTLASNLSERDRATR
jgi:diguanylate cyclase (GGDEF)-like protein